MARIVIIGSEVYDPLDGEVMDQAPSPLRPWSLLFPFSGVASTTQEAVPRSKYPLRVSEEFGCMLWHRVRRMYAVLNVDFGGVVVNRAFTLNFNPLPTPDDETSCDDPARVLLRGGIDESVGGAIRTSGVEVELMPPSDDGPRYFYREDDDPDSGEVLIPRMIVRAGVTWDVGTEFFFTLRTDEPPPDPSENYGEGTMTFYGKAMAHWTDGYAVSSSLTISAPAVDGYWPYGDAVGGNPISDANDDTQLRHQWPPEGPNALI